MPFVKSCLVSITFKNHPLRIVHMQKVYFIVASYLSGYNKIIIPMHIFSICFHCLFVFFFLVLIFTLQNFIKTVMIIIIIKFIGLVDDGDRLDYRVYLFISFEKNIQQESFALIELNQFNRQAICLCYFSEWLCAHLQRKLYRSFCIEIRYSNLFYCHFYCSSGSFCIVISKELKRQKKNYIYFVSSFLFIPENGRKQFS